MPFVMDKSKSKKELKYLKDSPYSSEVQSDISDLQFVQDSDFQCLASHLDILNAVTTSA